MTATPRAGLRERKKARTRATIAAAAARLFGGAGFHAVTMVEVAQAADVSEQTVYNYFPTKESLVFDRVDELRHRLLATVADRDADTDLLDAYTHWLRDATFGATARRATHNPGGMPRLVAADPGLRRHLLDHADQMATILADRLADREHIDPVTARTLTDALLHVFVRTIDRLGVAAETRLDALETDTLRALSTLRPALTAVNSPGRPPDGHPDGNRASINFTTATSDTPDSGSRSIT